MTFVTKQERQQIKSLVSSPQWGAVENVAKYLCANLGDTDPVGETEWETTKNILINEGQKRGIRLLLHELQKQLHVE